MSHPKTSSTRVFSSEVCEMDFVIPETCCSIVMLHSQKAGPPNLGAIVAPISWDLDDVHQRLTLAILNSILCASPRSGHTCQSLESLRGYLPPGRRSGPCTISQYTPRDWTRVIRMWPVIRGAHRYSLH